MTHDRDIENKLINKVLEKLSYYFEQKNVEEILVNQPGEVVIKYFGKEWERFEDPEITYKYLGQVFRFLSHLNMSAFEENDLPIVSCEIPGKPFRLQGIQGPNVYYNLSDRKGVCLAIRSLAGRQIEYKDFNLSNGIELPGLMRLIEGFEADDKHIDQINDIIKRHQSILISGATSTGKTTFLGKVVEAIDERNRVLSIEDTREVHIPQWNRVRLIVPRNRSTQNSVTYKEILDAVIRLTPDWIVCGEVSVSNAAPLVSLMGKGHPIITTVHASTPQEALQAFINNMATDGASIGNSESMMSELKRLVGCIIQIERRDGKRRVVDIVYPKIDEAKIEIAKNIEEKEEINKLLKKNNLS